ncbi:GNAT family N-acetyltransferase [Nocardia stercoris]|uniref:GNAT family N-acetyltransferase n=1 Tax=Nocardia stercoris TaxID=2483361 RepID=A0A3M2L4K3_9NOCA|nr:GNAT family N-acetyltransferase [Nocardia stercoris]RMI29448.1 GNAT family N-acetyltransferase [Nocardia stercoris]
MRPERTTAGPGTYEPVSAACGTNLPAESTVRVADADDLATLRLLRRRWTEENSGGPVTDDDFDERFDRWLGTESSRRTIFLAEVGDQAVGMVNLTLFERMPQPGRPASRWGYLGNAFVLADYRNRGIGTALLTALVAYADESGCARIVLSPTEPSLSFYQRAGFGPATMLLARVRPD